MCYNDYNNELGAGFVAPRVIFVTEALELYSVGELIVYGGTGVCRVEGIDEKQVSDSEVRRFYRLKPLYQSGTISVPVDGKVFMRPVISREEAEAIIDQLPNMPVRTLHERNFTQLAAHYQQLLCSHECSDVAGLVVSIRAKKRESEQSGRRFGQVDAKFMKRAETLLYGEISAALGIPFDEVEPYIEKRLSGN